MTNIEHGYSEILASLDSLKGYRCAEQGPFLAHVGAVQLMVLGAAEQHRGAVETFAQERQMVLDAINLYGDETLHKALDALGWPPTDAGGR